MPDARPEPDHTPQEVVRLRAEIERLRAALGAASAEAESLRSLAHEDALTGLLNRRGFVHELSRGLSYAQRYGAPAAVLLVDLDRFKPEPRDDVRSSLARADAAMYRRKAERRRAARERRAA